MVMEMLVLLLLIAQISSFVFAFSQILKAILCSSKENFARIEPKSQLVHSTPE